MCVLSFVCCIYIEDIIEELEIERSRETEKRRVLKLAAYTTQRIIDYYQYYYRENNT